MDRLKWTGEAQKATTLCEQHQAAENICQWDRLSLPWKSRQFVQFQTDSPESVHTRGIIKNKNIKSSIYEYIYNLCKQI